MYQANVIEVFIASPSDVKEERDVVRDVLEDINITDAKERGLVLRSLGWEKNTFPSAKEDRPQACINAQLLDRADLLIGIFWTRFGAPTGSFPSGTVEEISKHIEAEKPAMLFFSNKMVNPKEIDIEQYQKIQDYKKSIQNKVYYGEFDKLDDFRRDLTQKLRLCINQEFKNLPEIKIEKNSRIIAPTKHDIELFACFRKELPSSGGSIAFIEQHNMAGWSFNRHEMDQLWAFLEKWKGAEFSFNNTDAEKLRSELYTIISEYRKVYLDNIFPVRGEFYSVPREWEEYQSDRFRKAVDDLHSYAQKICDSHQKLMQYGVKHLSE